MKLTTKPVLKVPVSKVKVPVLKVPVSKVKVPVSQMSVLKVPALLKALLALLAAGSVLTGPMLAGSVLVGPALVGPALAATGSYEVLVDHDNNSLTRGMREFAGASRYGTSLATAKRYLQTAADLGNPSTAVVMASGESLIDAAASATLARALNAPVLLTPADRLFLPAAHLIEGAGIAEVFVVGGEAAISEQVAATLRGINGVTNVKRIGGENRFETAALIAQAAQQSGLENSYCERAVTPASTSNMKAVVLVAGDSDTLADIAVAGPLGYAMGLPVLLTSTGGIPTETTDAMTNLGVEHVVVIGGQYSLGDMESLDTELDVAGVDKVTRLQGADQFVTSIVVLNELKRCLGAAFDDTSVALIGDTALPDGISAAPILGQGLVLPGKSTPVLLVRSQTLPLVVRDYLLGTEFSMKIFAIGGTGAISREITKAAVSAANGEIYEPIVNLDTYVSASHDSCELDSTDPEVYSVGFGIRDLIRDGLFPAATGTYNVAVLFVDFPDAPAEHSTSQEDNEQLTRIEQYVESNSYNQLDVVFDKHNSWLRAPQDYNNYLGETAIEGLEGVYAELADDITKLANSQFDFSISNYDALMLVLPSTQFSGGVATQYTEIDEESIRRYIHYQNPIVNAFERENEQSDITDWWSVAAHELIHGFGLPDLYLYDSDSSDEDSEDLVDLVDLSEISFGRMGLTAGFPLLTLEDFLVRPAPEMIAWNRWLLDWLHEDQIVCLTDPVFDETFTINPIGESTVALNENRTAMIVIPIAPDRGVVIEARQQSGYDEHLPHGGIVAYEVNASIRGGELPIRLWPVNESDPLLQDSFPVHVPGLSITDTLSDGTELEVTVLSEDHLSYIVNITRS